MRNEMMNLPERLLRLIEYAKNPSIWWNGVEYKWDKKQNKYLHWTTVNGRPVAEEPPYQALNPLFAAAGIDPDTEEKPLPPMTANSPIGKKKETSEIIKKYGIYLAHEMFNKKTRRYEKVDNVIYVHNLEAAKRDGMIDEIKARKSEIIDTLKAQEAAHKAAKEDRKNRINAIEGLAEIKAARSRIIGKTLAFVDHMKNDGDFSFFDTSKEEYDFDAAYQKYPKAAAYLRAEALAESKDEKLAEIGKKALDEILYGDWQKAKENMLTEKKAYDDKRKAELAEKDKVYDLYKSIEAQPPTEEKPLPPMTANSHIGRETNESSSPPQPLVEIDKELESSDLTLEEKKERLASWAHTFFSGHDSAYEEEFRNFFDSDAIPFYAKCGMVEEFVRHSRYASNRDSIKTFREYQVVGPIHEFYNKTLIKAQEYLNASWKTLAEGYHLGASGWNNRTYVFLASLSAKAKKRYETRESAIKNARGLISIPTVLSEEEKQDVLDRVKYIADVAAMPTTTDFEACMLLGEIRRTGDVHKNIRFAKEFVQKFQNNAKLQDAIEEITSRSPETAPKKPEEVHEQDLAALKTVDNRRDLDLSVPIAQSADDFLSIVDKVRAEEMMPEEAERDRIETQALVNACDFIANDPDGSDLATKINKEKVKYATIAEQARSLRSIEDFCKFGEGSSIRGSVLLEILKNRPNYKLDSDEILILLGELNLNPSHVRKEEEAEISRLQTEKTAIDQTIADMRKERAAIRRIAWYREGCPYDHQKTLNFLKKAFPDRGGAVFFSPEWKAEALRVMSHHDKALSQVAEEVFDIFDLIGRCYNVGGKNFEPPVIEFGATGKHLGEYYSVNNRLRISNRKNWVGTETEEIRTTFAHELGHWLEHLLGDERIQKNAEFVKQNVGHLKLTSEKQALKAGKRFPRLTVRPDGYGLKIYKQPWTRLLGAKPKDLKDECTSTELISTGTEYLIYAASMFATRSPEHFNLLLDNYKEFSK